MLAAPNSRSRNRSKSPGRRESPPKSSKSSHSKKYYDPSSESEAVTESDSEDDRRHSRYKKESKDRRRHDTDSSSEESEDDRRRKKDSKSRDKQRYDHVKVPEQSRHLSYSEQGHAREYDAPGSYREHDDRDRHTTRHMSYVEVDHDQRPKMYQTESGQYVAVAGGGRYQVAPKYEYAQPTQNLKYISKSDPRGAVDGKQYYVQTANPQMVAETRRSSKKETDEKSKKSRKGSDDERSRSSRKESEKSKHRSSRYSESESETDSDSEYERHKLSKKKSGRRDSSSDRDKRKREKEREREKEKAREHEKERDKHRSSTSHDTRPQFVEVKPGQKSSSLMVADSSGRTRRLSTGQGAAGALSLVAPGQQLLMGGLPPGSPLLEPYHGTYQSISPMPSPMAMPGGFDDDLSDFEPLKPANGSSSSDSDRPKRLKKRVEIYDPEPDALAIAAELKHQKPGAKPLIKILPPLSDDNMMHLRAEYKKHFKVNGKGINIAKHIKLKVTGNIGKIAYATALGRWESEAHWANFWYQSGTSRRELLIESLIGRSNIEVRKIKEAFSDKRYNDSLEKCMQAELRKDKFRNAILIALQEKRQDELAPISKTLVAEDVRDLYKALVSKDGGETAMIEIIVVRSDLHLRQVLKMFEEKYQRNFAREMIQKSQNLVGEVLAHILNGVLNKPVRDAQLLHQALAETSKDRTDLLVSRLVRFHWEPKHLERVKLAYRQKYGKKLERDIEAGTKGDFGDFCLALAEGAKR